MHLRSCWNVILVYYLRLKDLTVIEIVMIISKLAWSIIKLLSICCLIVEV